MTRRILSALVTAAVLLAGCTHYSLIEPSKVFIADTYTVDPQIAWSATRSGKFEVWTIDGPALEQVRFVKGLKPGDPLITGQDEAKRPKFTAGMTAVEVMEFVVDSFNAAGLQTQGRNLRPEKFGGADGFRFDTTYVTPGGLEGESVIVGAIIKDRLHLISYSGVGGYYATKYRDQFERIVRSIELR